MSNAENITRKSGSNLAFAFFCLPKEKRRDISIFYAFCRHVDDIADDPGLPTEERRARLESWRSWIRRSSPGEPDFAGEIRELIRKYSLKVLHFEDILNGVEMDLQQVRFTTSANTGGFLIEFVRRAVYVSSQAYRLNRNILS